MERLTIYDIKRLTAETSPYFFSRNTMRFFRQRLSDFKVYKQDDGRYKIIAPMPCGNTTRFFNPKNNELERE